ncbi:MAG: ABC transporter substrate-binding protein, partial [Acidimicrobiia bacterium]|nr:ABC transporter substrate-binding protein [Acidimicrobiia bacterium]
IARNVLGWETAAVIGDDYSFAWTSTAGFIAEFCAAGGDVISRVYPPLNTTDYSGFVEQLPGPDEVDGYFWAVGGAGLVPALNAFEDAKGDVVGEQHMGNLFWGIPDVFTAIGPRVVGSYSGGFGNAPDLQTDKAAEFRRDPVRGLAGSGGCRVLRRLLHELLQQHLGPDRGPEGDRGRPFRWPRAVVGGDQQRDA